MQTEVLSFFAAYIEAELGIVYAEHNYFQLENRLEEISKIMALPGTDDLFVMAKGGIHGTFKQLLLDVATNNETSFFRDPKVFSALETSIIPELFGQGPRTVNIWSAACSTGQESLSMAMLIQEWADKNAKPVNFKIECTDISERALIKAKSATYSRLEVQRGLPPALMAKYFKTNDHDQLVANVSLTNHLNHRSLNLKSHYNFAADFDLIFCRNVLIYHSVAGKKAILEKLSASLRPGGYLIMGSGESMVGLSDDFLKADIDIAVVYQKRTPVRAVG